MESIPKKSGIYQIRNLVNGKVYVGSAVNLHRRALAHFNKLLHQSHHSIKLQRAYNKYGPDNLTFEVLEYVEEENLLEREQYYINTLEAVSNGYNINPIAGNSSGYKHSESSIQKMKQARANNPPKGMSGKRQSEEAKRHLSNIMKGENNPMYGKHHSEESLKKMRGRKFTDEHKHLISLNHAHKKAVICLDTQQTFDSINKASKIHNLDPSSIVRVCKGRQKTAGGYHWAYMTEVYE